MKKYLTLFAFVLTISLSHAQEMFITQGKITFEKRVNMVRRLEDNDWMPDDFKDKIQKYQSSNWEYTFDASRSLFKAGKKAATNTGSDMFIFAGGSDPGQLYTNFEKNTRVIQKNVSGIQYLLNDSVPKLEWKIQQDVRTIAGYECRKAIARFNDTVYAVAFYTDKILTKGGPEGFTGLPGMILGLAIPRYSTTWFATKVEVLPAANLDFTVPAKGDRADTEKDYKKMVDYYLRWRDDAKKLTDKDIRRDIYGLVL